MTSPGSCLHPSHQQACTYIHMLHYISIPEHTPPPHFRQHITCKTLFNPHTWQLQVNNVEVQELNHLKSPPIPGPQIALTNVRSEFPENRDLVSGCFSPILGIWCPDGDLAYLCAYLVSG